jgi:phosphoserine phosphatase SerB
MWIYVIIFPSEPTSSQLTPLKDFPLLESLSSKVFQLKSQTQITLHVPDADVSELKFNAFYRHKRLIVFDMDSTLIQHEVIDEIAKYAGVVDKVAEITHQAMQGQLDFKESLKLRVSLLKDTPASVLDLIKADLKFMPGAKSLCRILKSLGYKLAVVSGGFMPLALYVQQELGLDYAFANHLKVSEDGLRFTGETVGPIVDAQRKADILMILAQAHSLKQDQVR